MNRGFRGDASAEPVAVLEAALQQLAQRDRQAHEAAPAEKPRPEVPAFIPADHFKGSKQGYFFSTGDRGTGYYLDDEQDLEPAAAGGRHQADPEELLREAEEQAEAAEVQIMDERSLRKLLNTFEKKAKENLELRMKYADEPMKFLENEVDLLSIIRGLAQVAADPNTLYPILIDSPAVGTLSGLLSHDNTDIAVEVMDLLQELTDADEEEDNEEVAGSLIDALVESNALELLVERLPKLNEAADEEATAVNNVLAIIEHAVEVDVRYYPDINIKWAATAASPLAEVVLSRTKLLKWLLQRIRVKGSDSNKQYASEILSILMQGHEPNAVLLSKSSGVDTLLVCLAGFKSKEPVDDLEQEYMENLFDTLCSCLLLPANRSAFVEGEGVELMHLLLKGKKSSRYGAIKAVDFATTRSPAACDRFVEAGALAQLFAIFMGRSKIKNSKGEAGDRDVLREVEERCVSIISNLFQGVTKTSRKERLAAKFVEAEFEKVDRLMEVAFRYESAVSAVEARLAEEAALLDEPVDEDELLMERLDAGLFTLQCCMVITAALWSTADIGLRKRLLAILHQRGHSLEMVRGYLREYYFSLGDEGAPDERTRQLQRLSQLLSGLGVDIAAEAAERGLGATPPAAADAGGGGQGDDGDVDGDADMELEDDAAPPPLPDGSKKAEQPRLQQVEQHGNGISDKQPQQQVSPPSDRQQQQQRHEPAAAEPPARQRSSSDRIKQPEDPAAARDRHKQRDREDRERDRQKERDREERHRERDRGDRERERAADRERDRDRRHRDKQDSRSRRRSHSRSRSRSRSKSPPGRREDAHRKGGTGGSSSSRHKLRRRSRSDSR